MTKQETIPPPSKLRRRRGDKKDFNRFPRIETIRDQYFDDLRKVNPYYLRAYLDWSNPWHRSDEASSYDVAGLFDAL